MGRITMDLETIFRHLMETPAFFDQGHPDAASLTWPKAPSEAALKWPLVLIQCPKGHGVGVMNLSFDSGTWTLHSHSDVEAIPAWPGNRSPHAGISLERTIVICAECQRQRPGKRQVLPVRGERLVEKYGDAVQAKKDWFRLP